MNEVILITGLVNFRITLDPTVWIFDERRFDLSERIPNVEGLAMELAPFLEHAEPKESATHVVCHRSQGEPITLTLLEAQSAYLCFAQQGKPIREGGPALLYLADGSNQNHPISHITELEVINKTKN